MQDFYFNESNLVNNELFIAGVEPGDFFVLEGNGEICFPVMRIDTRNGMNGTVISSIHFEHGDCRVKFIANVVISSDVKDFNFSSADCVDNSIFIPNVEPGDFFVLDGHGEICFPIMKPHTKDGVKGTLVSGIIFEENEIYRIKYIRGAGGGDQIKIQYSENGEDWHDTLGESDIYMRVSSDGGNVWTKAIALGASSSGDSEEYTGELIHNFIEPISSGSAATDYIVNKLVYPEMWMFCEIMCHYEVANKASDGNFHFSYHHWNKAYPPQVFLNGSDIQLDSSMYTINFKEGYIIPNWEVSPADTLVCTYNFNWFTAETMISFVNRAVGTINYRGSGQTTNYTVDTMPEGWYGIDADLVIAMMCEHLVLAQTMWYGKLIFAISANDLYNGGGGSDIAGNLESMKRNAEDRAYSAIDNEKFRAPAYLAKPTPAYWRAVTLGTGIRPGPHGQIGYGKQRGIKFNRMIGMTGPDLGL